MFFQVKTSEEVFEILKGFSPVGEESVRLDDALGRALSRNILSPEDLPGFHRSTMDGYAVKSKDTFGAAESLPAFLEVAGEVIMGQVPAVSVTPGKAVKISTGGMLPEGADSVVMIEYCQSLDDKTIEISRAVSPLENVILPSDDVKTGSIVLEKGAVLRPQDIGLLAGLGISEVKAHKIPVIAIISTGDEIIPVDQKPGPGQVRDINSYTLASFCRQAGIKPVVMGLCGDSFDELHDKIEKGLELADSLWISGGSSVGTRDLTLKVFESFDNMDLLVHGITISPGKPTIIARIGEKAVFGLPGHTASAMVVTQVFLNPFLSRLSGEIFSDKEKEIFIKAELSRNIESASGRDDYIRVKLINEGDRWIAKPVYGKSGLISTLVEAHGLVRVDRNTEGLYKGQEVKVIPFVLHRGNFL